MDSALRYTIKDVEQMENHAELVDGLLYIDNKTTVSHNLAVSEISGALKNYISAKAGNCMVFTENVALYVNELCNDDGIFFLPDVMVVCGNDGIDESGVHKAPLFIAEVTSETTRKNDYCAKLETYRKIGVKEYWIVDLQRKTVYKYLDDDNYIPVTYVYPEIMKVSVYPGLSIDLSDFMLPDK